LADLVHRFATASAEPTDAAIGEAQVRICQALNFDCCALLRIVERGAEPVETFTWTHPELEADFPFSPNGALHRAMSDVVAGQTVRVPETAGLSDETQAALSDPAGPRTRSVLMFPLSVGGAVLGAMAFGTMRGEAQWTASVEARLRTAADIFADLLARARGEQDIRQLQAEVQRLRDQLQANGLQAREQIKIDRQYDHIVGKSAAITRVIEQVEQVASTESIVLLTGETGTGKELIAELVHDLSPRRGRPIVKVNCAALPPSLVESELFGRERGAYTGALTREIGRFELANHSTIFLDELGELPLELQAKLLRVLQKGEFERVGSPKTIRVNVRVIAATNRDLKRCVAEGRFREDLYYRLNVFPIEIPPLRERPEDIPMLAWAFAGEFGNAMGKVIEAIPQASMDALQRYAWPGNVRELRNVIERAMIVTTGGTLRVEIPKSPFARPDKTGPLNLRDLERQHILEVMRQTRWRVRGPGGAAELLGLKPTTLEARMAKLGISRTPADGGA
jgi:transcriptional regulator with GAF, ATPase, and Fis domain